MIRQFRVQNFKALRDVTLDLTPIHVLVGPNDSGKSSILQALGGLCRSVDHAIADAFIGEWTGRELANANVKRSSITLGASGGDGADHFEYTLALDFHHTNRNASWSREQLSNQDGQHELPEFSRDETGMARRLRLNLGGFEDDPICRAAQQAHDLLSPVALLRFTAHDLALSSALNPKRGYRLEPSGFGLPALLDTILSENRNRFIALEDRLKDIFPEIESIQIPPSEAYDAPVDPSSMVLVLKPTVGKALRIRFKNQSQPVPASQLSEGILYVLGYLALLYSPEAPRVLLIEEPETGLHPERLAEIVKILRELIAEHPQTQILMTTHAPYLVDEFQPEEVTVCFRDAEGDVKVKRLSESPLVHKHLDLFSLGEIWTGEGDEALANPPEETRHPDETHQIEEAPR